MIGRNFRYFDFDFISKIFKLSAGNCDKCRLKFAFNVKHEHIVVDRLKRKMFCSKKCVYAYVRDDTEMVVCCMCQHRMEFYKCIRRCYDDRCFCSLGCIQAAEQNIERLLKNDEQFHLDILEFKCKSRMEVDMDSDVESDDLNQGSKQYQICEKAFFLNQCHTCCFFRSQIAIYLMAKQSKLNAMLMMLVTLPRYRTVNVPVKKTILNILYND